MKKNMEQYIDKSAVVAEIERRIREYKNEHAVTRQFVTFGKIKGLEEVLSFLDTLEVKEVDVEEKATQLSQKYFPNEGNIWARTNIEAHKCKSACIEIVEWFKTQKGVIA